MSDPTERQRWRGIRERRVSLLVTVWLVVIWVAVFGSIDLLHILGGVLVALAVQVTLPLPHRSGNLVFHPLELAWLILRFAWDLVAAGLHVSLLVLTGRKRKDAIIRCPIRSDNPEYVTMLVAMTTLIPGTVVVRIDRGHRIIYLHCLDIEGQGGVESIRRATAGQEERILRAVAPREVQHQLGLGVTKS